MKLSLQGRWFYFVRCLAVGAILSSPILMARADCVPTPDGLVSWWAAEGDATDQAGTNNGTLLSSATYGSGEVGQAFSFNGGDGSVLVADSPSLHFTNALTVEAWVYVNSYDAGANEIVSKYFQIGTPGNQKSFTTSINQSGTAYIILSSTGNTSTQGVDFVQLNTANTVPPQQWTHFAATYDGATVKIYLNGVLENQASWTQGIFPGTAPLVIGATTLESVFRGLIDEVSLYNRALLDSEIQAIYNAGSAGKCAGPAVILSQPQSQSVYVGTNITFAVGAGGTPPLFYQWFFNSTNIPSGTNSTLTLTNVQIAQAGSYSVQVSNSAATATSSDAVLTVSALPPCLPAPPGIVSWWKAEGDTLDQAGTNDGAFSGSVSYAAGLLGQAFNFTGGEMVVPDAPSLRLTNALTIEAWIYSRGGGGFHEMVSKWFGGNGTSFTTSVDPAGHASLLLSINGSANANGVDHLELYTTGVVGMNTWTHFAATYDGATAKIYLNGVLDTQAAWTNPIFAGSSPLCIGKAFNQSAFNGLIDEPAIYNRALSDSEVQSIYDSTVVGKCSLTPSIVTQPQSQTVFSGTSASFGVGATGTRPFSYQWKSNNVSIPGATNATLLLQNVQVGQSGSYSVLVSNPYGTSNSVAAIFTVNPAPACDPPATGIVAWWNAESNALDQAGVNDGTLGGGVSYVPGLVGRAFEFHGGSVSVPDSTWLRVTNGLTIEAWINPRSWGSPHEIVSKWFNGNGANYTTSIDSSGHLNLLLSVNGTANTPGVDHLELYATNIVPLNQWTHFAATYDGSLAKIYLNGVVDSQAVWTNKIFAGTAPVFIGAAANQSGFDGFIDEPSIYNRGLSAAEIQAIVAANLSGKCPLPVAILSGPLSQTVPARTNVVLRIFAGGARPLSYQWKFNGANILNATNTSLSLTNIQPNSAGSYSVGVTNAGSGVVSSDGVVKVRMVLVFGNGALLTNAQSSFGGSVTVQMQNVYTNGLIFYTLDGSIPTLSSPIYNGPFTVFQNASLRTLAYSQDFSQSTVSDPISILILPAYSLTATTAGGGTIALNPAGGVYLSNTTVTATATPASGWRFLQWLVDAGGTNTLTSVTMSGNKSIKAVFGTTLTTGGAGNGVVIPGAGVYPYGAVVAISAIPQSGSYFAIWNNGTTANPLYLPITNANPSISGLFQTLSGGQASLAVIPSGRGRVTVNPSANVYSTGASVTLSAVPDPAQSFIGWSGDASGTNNPLNLTMTQSQVITANFTHNSMFTVTKPQGGMRPQGFQFTVDGDYGGIYRIDSGTSLVSWLPWMTVTNFYGTMQFVDPRGTNSPSLFYRAVQLQ